MKLSTAWSATLPPAPVSGWPPDPGWSGVSRGEDTATVTHFAKENGGALGELWRGTRYWVDVVFCESSKSSFVASMCRMSWWKSWACDGQMLQAVPVCDAEKIPTKDHCSEFWGILVLYVAGACWSIVHSSFILGFIHFLFDNSFGECAKCILHVSLWTVSKNEQQEGQDYRMTALQLVGIAARKIELDVRTP